MRFGCRTRSTAPPRSCSARPPRLPRTSRSSRGDQRLEFGEPLFSVVAIAVLVEIRAADRVVHDLCARVVLVFAHQPVPLQRQLADGAILRPGKPMQIESWRRVDVLDGQGPAALVVENHQARPVLARVPGLNLVEKFALRLRHVVMLANDYCLVSLLLDVRLEPGEIGAAKHVAVHADGPAPDTCYGRDEEPVQ